MRHLDETHAALGKSSRHQALPAQVARAILVEAVESQSFWRLTGDILQFRCSGLHAEGAFERRDAALEGGVGAGLTQALAVHLGGKVKLHALDTGGSRAGNEWNGRAFRVGGGVADRRTVIDGWKEGAGIVVDAAVSERRADGDEAGEVLIFGAESVGDPGTHGRTDERVAASEVR